MGRTNPTFRDFVRRQEQEWQSFRRGLRRQHVDDFDRLFEDARRFADAASYMNAADPHRALLVSMLLAQKAELRELRERVEALDAGDE
ncbi:hypothetical protein ACFQH6_11115 [Halobacteriaceae archaeon GCM10025711]